MNTKSRRFLIPNKQEISNDDQDIGLPQVNTSSVAAFDDHSNKSFQIEKNSLNDPDLSNI